MSRLEISLHDREFKGETLEDVTLVFNGSAVTMRDCKLINCQYRFEGEAATTLEFLSKLYKLGAATLVEDLFEAIRVGTIHELRRLDH